MKKIIVLLLSVLFICCSNNSTTDYLVLNTIERELKSQMVSPETYKYIDLEKRVISEKESDSILIDVIDRIISEENEFNETLYQESDTFYYQEHIAKLEYLDDISKREDTDIQFFTTISNYEFLEFINDNYDLSINQLETYKKEIINSHNNSDKEKYTIYKLIYKYQETEDLELEEKHYFIIKNNKILLDYKSINVPPYLEIKN